MNEFNFNSQVCTSCEQSKRLLALGLKPETADCHWGNFALFEDYEVLIPQIGKHDDEYDIPAWSLHRLMSMLTTKRKCLLVHVEADLYDVLIDRIEHEINEGYFNKEYLV